MKTANHQLTRLVKASETKSGHMYRLLKNQKRSRDLLVTALGISPKGHPLFVFNDVENHTTLLLNDVPTDELVQLL